MSGPFTTIRSFNLKLLAAICAACLALLSETRLLAQGAPTLALGPAVDAPRSHAPLQLDATIGWSSQKILQGRLKLEYFVGDRLAHTWISREFTLSGSQVKLPAMVPPVILQSDIDALHVRGTILTEDRQYDQDFDIIVPDDFKRAWVVGVVHPRTSRVISRGDSAGSDDRFSWAQPYQIDRILTSRDDVQDFSCRIQNCDPEDFPSIPLELMSYDLIVVTRDGFSQLANEQLSALAAWVEAGGSAHVMVERAKTSQQQELLRRMICEDPARQVLDFERDGTATMRNDVNRVIAAPGIGRALLTVGKQDLSTDELDPLALYLWRVRRQQVPKILATGSAISHKPREVSRILNKSGYSPDLNPADFRPFSVVSPGNSNLALLLMPEQIEGVPFSAVAWLLGACLIVIGPGEYLLLTWLRRRKWTWIIFPAVTVAFALGTIAMAQHYLGSTDFRNAVTFHDLAADGRVVRSSRYEMLFAATQRDVQDELTGEFAAPMENRVQPTTSPYPQAFPMAQLNPATWSGHVPMRYQFTQTVRQWEPQLTRFTSIPAKPGAPLPAFSSLAQLTPELLQDQSRWGRILDDLHSQHPEGVVILRHGDRDETRGTLANSHLVEELGLPLELLMIELEKNVSHLPIKGTFHYVSQLSPNGAGNFEDLGVFDRTDRQSWMVAVIEPEGKGNYAVYRRVIQGVMQ